MELEIQHIKLYDAANVVPRERFIAINAYFKKQERYQISNITLYHKQQEKEKQTNPKVSRRK